MTENINNWPDSKLIGPTILQALPARKPDSHKGDFGAAGILGGTPGMTGAVLLCARAALYLGAGKVYAASLADNMKLDIQHPELMWHDPEQLLTQALTVLAVGPGLGRSERAQRYLDVAMQTEAVLLLDADALNLLAASQSLKNRLARRSAPCLLTPHPGEAASLLGSDTRTVQRDRRAAALKLAEEYRASVVLKGAGSICVSAERELRINPTGNSGLSSAGTGDVLTGMIAALLAQGLSPFAALQLAVYLHGAAADSLLEQGVGPVGLTASEIMIEARNLLNRRDRPEASGDKTPGRKKKCDP
ncbi:MAG TPA: NAD(P)H-hydrate dehydratase [Burkholderiales bacterium]|nr:NAD(P)H-hydrate dehydratase [Burkholderiales bacterium]